MTLKGKNEIGSRSLQEHRSSHEKNTLIWIGNAQMCKNYK